MSQSYPFPPSYLPPIDVAKAVSEIESYVAPQPPPKNDPKAKPLWPMIIAEADAMAASYAKVGTNEGVRKSKTICAMVDDMKKRHEFGVGKYGVPLVAKNDRDHLSDAYQELLDAIVYLRAQIETLGGLPDPPLKIYAKDLQFRTLMRIYAQTLENVIELRTILAKRDGR